ncbi:hypothetical protein DOTSEDRAFT_75076 [Dothistroma septosporum NZE10]|uniref:Uncharacterized protein n=1 Tax=Dothistroma septosporum (strain NZE10 / CBS 128990) TaxID=675120 RepID=M2YK03_DOTSN|nr:hypothetical protein DOTSEDRAFT_75076 [Dothistroma septosporum NZE10]
MRQVRITQHIRQDRPARLRPILKQEPELPLPLSQCVFWTLPRELRDAIYAYVWRDEAIVVAPLKFDGRENLSLGGHCPRSSLRDNEIERALVHLNDLMVSTDFYQEARISLLRNGTIVFGTALSERKQISALALASIATWAMQNIQAIEVSAGTLFGDIAFSQQQFPILRRIRVADCFFWCLGVDMQFGNGPTLVYVNACCSMRRVRLLENCQMLERLAQFITLRDIKFQVPACKVCERLDRDFQESKFSEKCHLKRTLASSSEMYVLSRIFDTVSDQTGQTGL